MKERKFVTGPKVYSVGKHSYEQIVSDCTKSCDPLKIINNQMASALDRKISNIASRSLLNKSDALLHKAEDLMRKREYEAALVLFYKGTEIDPSSMAFKEGARRAKEAILNAVERMEKVGDSVELVGKPRKTRGVGKTRPSPRPGAAGEGQNRPPNSSLAQYIEGALERVTTLRKQGRPEDANSNAVELLAFLDRWRATPDARHLYIARTQQELALAHMQVGLHTEAVDYAKDMLCNAKEAGERDLIMKSYRLVGETCAKSGDLKQAVIAWEQTIADTEDPEARAWLFHELGRSCLLLNRLNDARRYGYRSLEEAQIAGCPLWSMRSKLLLGQVYTHLGDYPSALNDFRQAGYLANKLGNEEVQLYVSETCNIIRNAEGPLQTTVMNALSSGSVAIPS